MATPILLPLIVPMAMALFLMLSMSADAQDDLPSAPADGDDVVVIEKELGDIVIMFYPQKAHKHVENFKSLASKQFYDGTRFHRTIKGFMVQAGDPNSRDMDRSSNWGTGRPHRPRIRPRRHGVWTGRSGPCHRQAGWTGRAKLKPRHGCLSCLDNGNLPVIVSICLHFLDKYIAHLLTFGHSLEDLFKGKGYSKQIGLGPICL